MSFDHLPDEIVGLICRFCDTAEIKSLRLSCRTLLKVANEHLLSEVVLFMNRESLEACEGIASHPVFSKTAKSLWIQADRPKETSFDEWYSERRTMTIMSHYKEASDIIYANCPSKFSNEKGRALMDAAQALALEIKTREEEKPGLSEKQLRYHFKQATRLACEAEEMLHDTSLFSGLRDVLSQCPKIESVDLTMLNTIRICTAKHNKAFQQALVHPFGDCDKYNSGVDAMIQLVLAASEVDFKPRMLRLGSLSHHVFTREDITDELRAFFDGLEELEWHFAVPYHDDDHIEVVELLSIMEDFNTGKNFSSLVEAAAGLKRLHLELPYDPDEVSEILLPSIVGNNTWDKLARVNLTGFEATASQLGEFLLRHAETLEEVSLAHVVLSVGDWPDCFVSFAGKLPGVRNFELRERFDYDEDNTFYWFGHLGTARGNKYSKRLSNYLVTGEGSFPRRPEEQESSDNEWSDQDDDTTDSEDDGGNDSESVTD